MNIHDAGASSSRRRYNTAPSMKLQPISDDEESEPSDYERMDEGGQRDEDCASTPLLHTTGNCSMVSAGIWTAMKDGMACFRTAIHNNVVWEISQSK